MRQLRHLRVEAAPDQHVREVDPRRADVDDRPGCRLGNVLDRERTADLVQDDGVLHLTAPSSAPHAS